MPKRKKHDRYNRDALSHPELDRNSQAVVSQDDRKASSAQVKDRDRYSYAMTLFVITLVALFGGSIDYYLHQRQAANAQPNNLAATRQAD